MAKKKQDSNILGLAILGLLAFGIFQFGTAAQRDDDRRASPAPRPAQSAPAAASNSSTVPLTEPRFVNVASLNVRHVPNESGPLIMALPRGTALKVLGRQDGWLLVDLNPTLEGWVSERLTTTQSPRQGYVPPGQLKSSR